MPFQGLSYSCDLFILVFTGKSSKIHSPSNWTEKHETTFKIIQIHSPSTKRNDKNKRNLTVYKFLKTTIFHQFPFQGRPWFHHFHIKKPSGNVLKLYMMKLQLCLTAKSHLLSTGNTWTICVIFHDLDALVTCHFLKHCLHSKTEAGLPGCIQRWCHRICHHHQAHCACNTVVAKMGRLDEGDGVQVQPLHDGIPGMFISEPPQKSKFSLFSWIHKVNSCGIPFLNYLSDLKCRMLWIHSSPQHRTFGTENWHFPSINVISIRDPYLKRIYSNY